MCGIVGYIGSKPCVPIILEGLKRMEYRGYDSAGVALLENGLVNVRKRAGKVSDLVTMMLESGLASSAKIGMGHTRWATHGEPNDPNAHPHSDCKGKIAIVHNGIIENYLTIKKKLLKEGHSFKSETDTEVLAHLIEEMYLETKNLFSAVRLALCEVTGTYGLVVISSYEPDKIIAARMGSPLIIGVGDGENLVAADSSAMVAHTRKVVYLDDGEIAEITKDGFHTTTIGDVSVEKEIHQLTFELAQIERAGYPHFMLKEINEQPETIRNAMRGRLLVKTGEVKLGGLSDVSDKLLEAKRIIIIGCGTSWHAGLVGEYMLEQMAQIPTEVEYASEFRYRNPVIHSNDVVLVISQSGETADTLAALRLAKEKGATVLGIVNVVGSTIARETEAGVYIHAGPEIGVASTKAFTSQLTVLALITLMIARAKGLHEKQAKEFAEELLRLPDKVSSVLERDNEIKELAHKFKDAKNFLYLGRGANFPVALEGALKLKEISYIHAEGYPAAEMKHGPIALIDHEMPVVFIVPKDAIYEKVINNIQEVKARKGRIIAVADEDDTDIEKMVDYTIRVPHTCDLLSPIVNSIPLQLLSYHMAVARGTNVDQPRNLAKSVTVE